MNNNMEDICIEHCKAYTALRAGRNGNDWQIENFNRKKYR
jgi:hypothetical protein